MVTFTTGSSFDPKIQTLLALNGTEMTVEKQENEYESKVYEFLEKSAIKKWFMPRHSGCVITKLEITNDVFQIYSEPQPFGDSCVNEMEWILLGSVPALAVGIGSLVFLTRKVSS